MSEIDSLEQFPRRYVQIEVDEAGADIRSMPFPPFRIIYEVIERQRVVRVLAVQHGAQGGPSKPR